MLDFIETKKGILPILKGIVRQIIMNLGSQIRNEKQSSLSSLSITIGTSHNEEDAREQ